MSNPDVILAWDVCWVFVRLSDAKVEDCLMASISKLGRRTAFLGWVDVTDRLFMVWSICIHYNHYI